jgi:hypothetical protein
LEKVFLERRSNFSYRNVTVTQDNYIIIIIIIIPNSGGGAQMGPLGTSATNWPTVPAAGDYEDAEFGGMKIGGGN